MVVRQETTVLIHSLCGMDCNAHLSGLAALFSRKPIKKTSRMMKHYQRREKHEGVERVMIATDGQLR